MPAQVRPLPAIVAVVLLGVLPVTAGRPAGAAGLAGRVELLEKGKRSTDKTLAVDATVIVFEPGRKAAAPKPVTVDMATVRKEFSPRILVVPAGSTVRFPNQDPILHNVFSVSGRNSFDLGLLGKGAGKSAVFREAGIVRVFCNVHHAMFGYIFVVSSPYWARVAGDGTFHIPDAPPGPGKLTVWNERSSPTTRELTLPVPPSFSIGIEITMPRIPPHKNKLGKSYGGGGYG
jgi:plastocyanin